MNVRSGFSGVVTCALIGCNALFALEEPTHKPDAGCDSGRCSGGNGGSGGTGVPNLGGEGGDDPSASGGRGGSSGGASATGGAAGRPGSGGDSAQGGQVGGGNGGSGGNAGSAGNVGGVGGASGGEAGGGGTAGATDPCVEDPTSCASELPSCEGMAADACNGESCCTTLIVPGCTGCDFPEGHVATVTDFVLDKYEVTVGRFRRFVNDYARPGEGAGAHPGNANSGWNTQWNDLLPLDQTELTDGNHLASCGEFSTWTADEGPHEQKPINCLSWFEAFAFCAWDEGFLPSEQHWEYAAAGGTENRYYPWDDATLDADHALYGHCGNGVSADCLQASILEVGSKPLGAGRWGHADLLGSMWEWILDYSGGVFPPGDPCNDCVNLNTNSARVIRGASFFEDETWLNVPRRHEDPPQSVWRNVGVRCARLPD